MVEVREDERDVVVRRLSQLKVAHGDLDAAIEALIQKGAYDDLQMQRMKKQKLRVKDEISKLEALLRPDIIA
ncbi:MAG: DUF465 domain-containing protein [Pseudomonadota bacterium]|nr:DUF465 domain-containing protein [Pseudomonadota bacterium]